MFQVVTYANRYERYLLITSYQRLPLLITNEIGQEFNFAKIFDHKSAFAP